MLPAFGAVLEVPRLSNVRKQDIIIRLLHE